MTFVDANSFLRTIVGPEPETRAMHETAAASFRAVARGEQETTTTEAILAAFILTSKRQYGLPPADAAARLGAIIELPGLLLPRGRKRLYLRALDLWSERPVLGFVDALTVATVEQSGMPLVDLRRPLRRLRGHQPSRPGGTFVAADDARPSAWSEPATVYGGHQPSRFHACPACANASAASAWIRVVSKSGTVASSGPTRRVISVQPRTIASAPRVMSRSITAR